MLTGRAEELLDWAEYALPESEMTGDMLPETETLADVRISK